MKKMYTYLLLTALAFSQVSCTEDYPDENPVTYGDTYMETYLSTDKAVYAPGEVVSFSLNKMVPDVASAVVRYRCLNDVVKEETLTDTEWTWTAPEMDGVGYLVEVVAKESDGTESVRGSVAVDVSSDPSLFPRNGFLSAYGKITEAEIGDIMNRLNRYHLNYIQFQDWHYKHHWPLGGTALAPMDTYTDICNRTVYLSTLENQISAAHSHGMQTLFYNLCYGALSDAANDGVEEEWYLFTDANHSTKDCHPLSSSFKSSIYIVNPANDQWQKYLIKRNDDVYKTLDFDGYQIDQLGDRGTLYDYEGNKVAIEDGFAPFISAMKTAHPDKRLVMNSVSQVGGPQIAASDVDFVYLEEWGHYFDDLAHDICLNYEYGPDKRNVVCAYMHRNNHTNQKYFNTPAVLLSDALIYAFGGARLELGEHMLDSEYFPNSDLRMDADLKKSMIFYYDFITAYENLLRGGGTWQDPDVSSSSTTESLLLCTPGTACTSAKAGSITVIDKAVNLPDGGNADVLQLINFNRASHLKWIDDTFTQKEPREVEDLPLSVAVSSEPSKVWTATPDSNHCSPVEVDFTYENGRIELSLPGLKYWTMVVIEY
ncbi:MAG: glycoside hydrolase family 66 protein [Bacteroidales bacterium]|nr:glycoside hydrolase family 66 protein [Bacteroidales bacterium]